MDKQDVELGSAIAVMGLILSLFAIPQVPALVCRFSGFFCPPVDAEDSQLQFFVVDRSKGTNLFEHLAISAPSADTRKYGNFFSFAEAQYIYFDLSFRYKSVRLFSYFTIKPVCYELPSNRQISCSIQNFSYDPSNSENTLEPEVNVFRKVAMLNLNREIGDDPRGSYLINLEIGGAGEALQFKEVSQRLTLF
jgi:hypothetical protein